MIVQSADVLPAPRPLTGSLLRTPVIFQVVALHSSTTTALRFTTTIRWSGGQSAFGFAVTASISGGVVSTTLISVEHDAELAALSATATVMRFVPTGSSANSETSACVVGLSAGTVFVWTGSPFNSQTTVSGSPSRSFTRTRTSTGLPHSTVADGGQVIVGG